MTAPTKQCTGDRHTPTNTSWRLGCRHPGAIAAHEKWLAEKKPHTVLPPAVDADGNCVAEKHNSRPAYLAGCRCDPAFAAYEKWRLRKLDNNRNRRARAYSRQFEAEGRRVERITGGRLVADPRRQWRGGRMTVGRSALFWITRGMFLDEATTGERLVAMIRIEGTLVPDTPWSSRPINNMELGERIGLDDRQVYRLRGLRDRLRDQRTRRRLADVRWKAAVVAAAIERGRGR